MTKSLLLGAILGGIVAFLWSFVSWSMLPWHESGIASFQDEDAFGRAVLEHTTGSGLYGYPGNPPTVGMTKEQKKAAETATFEKMKKGPMVFAAIRRDGYNSYVQGICIQLGIQILAAFLLTWLVLKTGASTYWGRVIFLTVAGLAAAVISDLPNWNWWGFSGSYTAVMVIDTALTWFIAGLVIARVTRPRMA
jgi:hypothetical protein